MKKDTKVWMNFFTELIEYCWRRIGYIIVLIVKFQRCNQEKGIARDGGL